MKADGRQAVLMAVLLACAALCTVCGIQLRRGRWLRCVAGFTFLTDEQLANPLRRDAARAVGTIMVVTAAVLALACLLPIGELADSEALVTASIWLMVAGAAVILVAVFVLLRHYGSEGFGDPPVPIDGLFDMPDYTDPTDLVRDPDVPAEPDPDADIPIGQLTNSIGSDRLGRTESLTLYAVLIVLFLVVCGIILFAVLLLG